MVFGRLKSFISSGSEEQPSPVRLPEGVRVYAVGDVHGRADLLLRLHELMREDREARPVDRAVEVFLGDYVDRGPQSRQVIDWMLEDKLVGDKRICLRGNHELMMQAFVEDSSVLGSWGQYGGLETLYSYGLSIRLPVSPEAHDQVQEQFRASLPLQHLGFLRSLRPMASLGGYFFAHAGVDPHKALADQVEDDLYWIREPFLDFNKPLEKMVVHGHTPAERPEHLVHRIGVDTGAYISGRLTCAVLEGAEVRFLKT